MLMHAPSSVSDRERVVPVIAAAALALENARLQVELQSRLEEQAALQRVATLVAQMGPPDAIFAAVTEEVGRLLGARTANMVRFDGGTDREGGGRLERHPGPVRAGRAPRSASTRRRRSPWCCAPASRRGSTTTPR